MTTPTGPSPTPTPGGSPAGTVNLSPETLAQLASLLQGGGGGGGTGTGTTGGPPPSPTGPTGAQGGLSKMLDAAADIATKADKAFEAIKKGIVRTDNLAKQASDPLRQMSFAIQKTFGGFRKANEEMLIGVSQDMREAYDTFAETYTATGDELIAAGRSQYVIEEYGKSINILKHVNITRKEYQDGFNNFLNEFRTTLAPAFAKGLKDRMVDVKLFQENFGLSSKELGDFVAKEVAQTGEATGQMMDDLKKFSYGLSQQTGISAKVIASNTVAIVNNMERFGNVTVEEAARMGTALAQLGVSYEQLNGMVGQFQGFDQAATKVGELSAVFGIHLDAVEMMNLANTDQEAMMFKIRDAFMESGQSLDTMNIAQKNLLKSQLGFTDMKQMEMFLSGQVDSLDELKEKTEEASTDEMTKKSIESFNKDIASMTLAGKTAEDKFARYKDDIAMSFSAIAPSILDARMNTEVQMNAFEQTIQSGVTKVGNSIESTRKDLANLYHGKGITAGEVITKLGSEIQKGVQVVPAAITSAIGGGITGAVSIFEDSILAPGSLSGMGLAILKGITGDNAATKEGVASFKFFESAFDTSISNLSTNITNNILPLAAQITQVIEESGLADVVPNIEAASPVIGVTVSKILTEYQQKLEEIQNLNDIPDMMSNLINELKQIAPNIESVVNAVNTLSGAPMNIKVEAGDVNSLQYILFEALQDYIHVNRGKFDISYVGE